MHRPTTGATHTFERSFTRDDVADFAAVSRDTQDRHTEPDDDGRVLVHGLLTATMATKIGGDLEVLARGMAFDFVRPVYSGDTVRCTWTTTAVEECDDRFDVTVDVVCDRAGDVVLRGSLDGLIRKSGGRR